MAARDTSGRPSAFAFLCLVIALAIGWYVAQSRNIRIEPSVAFLEVLLREMKWMWALGGLIAAMTGCIASEKARNRGASGLLMGPLAIACLVLALGYGIALLASSIDGGVARIFSIFR